MKEGEGACLSLKDLKNRIESVKSTRKITKAMQMVAAAKLRRAQEAAEMARPYAEKMEAVMSGLAQAVGQSESAPRLLAGTGSDQVHLLVVMTAERGLCGGFNSSIVRLARAHRQPQGRRQDGEDPDRRQEGPRAAEARPRGPVRGPRGPERRQAPRLCRMPPMIARDLLDRFDAGEFDVATIFFNRFQSVISQIPTETQVIPASFEAAEDDEPTRQRSTITNRPKRAFWPTFCRAVWRRRSSPRFWKTPHPSRARGCPQWTTPPATPAK
jgi:F-type H+-transporting ATPase subunit gamma